MQYPDDAAVSKNGLAVLAKALGSRDVILVESYDIESGACRETSVVVQGANISEEQDTADDNRSGNEMGLGRRLPGIGLNVEEIGDELFEDSDSDNEIGQEQRFPGMRLNVEDSDDEFDFDDDDGNDEIFPRRRYIRLNVEDSDIEFDFEDSDDEIALERRSPIIALNVFFDENGRIIVAARPGRGGGGTGIYVLDSTDLSLVRFSPCLEDANDGLHYYGAHDVQWITYPRVTKDR